MVIVFHFDDQGQITSARKGTCIARRYNLWILISFLKTYMLNIVAGVKKTRTWYVFSHGSLRHIFRTVTLVRAESVVPLRAPFCI
jgi:hypothetical protein